MLDAFYEELDKQRREWAEERLRPLWVAAEPEVHDVAIDTRLHDYYIHGIEAAMRALGVEP